MTVGIDSFEGEPPNKGVFCMRGQMAMAGRIYCFFITLSIFLFHYNLTVNNVNTLWQLVEVVCFVSHLDACNIIDTLLLG